MRPVKSGEENHGRPDKSRHWIIRRDMTVKILTVPHHWNMCRQRAVHIRGCQQSKAVGVDDPVYVIRTVVNVMDGWVGHRALIKELSSTATRGRLFFKRRDLQAPRNHEFHDLIRAAINALHAAVAIHAATQYFAIDAVTVSSSPRKCFSAQS